MTIRVLADREPYTTYEDVSHPRGEGDVPAQFTGLSAESIVILNGPADLDGPSPDILVMPVEDFLRLRQGSGSAIGIGIFHIPYGPVALMEKAFEWGCVDYLREPWTLPELRARGGRFRKLRFRLGEATLELRGIRLASETASIDLSENERVLLRLLVLNAPLPVPREAASSLLPGLVLEPFRAIGRCVVSLRRKMEKIEPGVGKRLHAIRAFGYRLDSPGCG